MIIWWALRNGKSDDSQSYFLAGRSMPWWIVGLSLFAASISSTTLIGQSGDAYHTGLAVFNYNLAGGILVMVFFAMIILPLYINSRIFTIPEFLEKRFDSRSRYYFSAICIIGNVFLDAAGALYAAALIIKLVLPEADLQLIIFAFALLCASYTIPGGLSSAINAELIQAVILILGSCMLCWFCFEKGGAYFAELWSRHDLLVSLIRPMDDSATPWLGLIVGMPITGLYFWANNQTLVQRVLSSKTIDEGRKGVLFAGFLTLLTLFIIAIPGVIARSLFPHLAKPDMVYPNMVMQLIPTGLLGIMLAALQLNVNAVHHGLLREALPSRLVQASGESWQDCLVRNHINCRPLGTPDWEVRVTAEILSGDAVLPRATHRRDISPWSFLAQGQRHGSLHRSPCRLAHCGVRI